jgi:hypothetical protein
MRRGPARGIARVFVKKQIEDYTGVCSTPLPTVGDKAARARLEIAQHVAKSE